MGTAHNVPIFCAACIVMGILVPNFEVSQFGAILPMAYVAASQNVVMYVPNRHIIPIPPLVTSLEDSQTAITMQFDVWSSLEARMCSKPPIDRLHIAYSVPKDGALAVDRMYELGYDIIKAKYPGFIDAQTNDIVTH